MVLDDEDALRWLFGEVEAPTAFPEVARSAAPSWAEACRPELMRFLKRSPDCQLVFHPMGCDPAKVPVHRQTLSLHSEVLHRALQIDSELPEMNHGDLAGWLEALHYMYPLRPQQQMDWARVAVMLPVLYKYDMGSLLDECCAWVAGTEQLMSAQKGDESYVLRWLELSEALQLDDIKEKCLESIRLLQMQGECAMLQDAESLSRLQNRTLVSVLCLAAAAAGARASNAAAYAGGSRGFKCQGRHYSGQSGCYQGFSCTVVDALPHTQVVCACGQMMQPT